jgi:hypothetical protein
LIINLLTIAFETSVFELSFFHLNKAAFFGATIRMMENFILNASAEAVQEERYIKEHSDIPSFLFVIFGLEVD